MASVKLPIIITGKDQSGKAFKSIKANLSTTSGAVSNLTKLVGVLGVSFSAGAIGNNLIRVNKEFQSLKASLITFTGSIDKADKSFKILKDFAATTPFQVQDVVGAFNILVARGIKPSQAQLESFADVAGAVGKSFGQFAEAVADAATGEFERLKEFGIKASKENGKVALSFDDLRLEVNDSASDITKALEEIAKQKFAGGAARQAATLGGAFSNLKDATDDVLFTIGEGGLSAEISRVIRNFTKFIRANRSAAKSISDTLFKAVRIASNAVGILAENIDLLKKILLAAFSALVIRKITVMVSAFITLSKTIAASTITVGAFKTIMIALKNPLKTLAFGVAGAAVAFTGLGKNIVESVKENESLKKIIGAVEDQFSGLTAGLDDNAEAMKNLENQAAALDEAGGKLENTYGDLTKTIEKQREEFKLNNEEFFETENRLAELTETQTKFDKALANGVISQEEFAKATKQIQGEIIDLNAEQNKTFSSGAIKGVKDYYNSISDNAKNATEFTGKAFSKLTDTLSDFFQSGKLNFGGFIDVIKKGLADLAAKALVSTGIKFLGEIFPSIEFADGGSVQRTRKFASGGRVTGPGGPRDDAILARLSAGEFVVQAGAVSKFGTGFFEDLNEGVIPKDIAEKSIPGFGLGGFFKKILSPVKKLLKGVSSVFKSVTKVVGKIVGSVADSVKATIKGILEGDPATIASLAFSALLPGVGGAITKNLGAGQGFIKSVTGGISKSFGAGIAGSASLTSIAKDVGIKLATNSLQDGLSNRISEDILGVKSDFGKGKSAFGKNQSDSFFRLVEESAPFLSRQTGGAVGAGQAFRVGEQGSEIFLPQRNGSVLPIKQGGSDLVGSVNQVRDEIKDLKKQITRLLAAQQLAGVRT